MNKVNENIQTVWESETPEVLFLITQYGEDLWTHPRVREDIRADKATIETRENGDQMLNLYLSGKRVHQEWVHYVFNCENWTTKIPVEAFKVII